MPHDTKVLIGHVTRAGHHGDESGEITWPQSWHWHFRTRHWEWRQLTCCRDSRSCIVSDRGDRRDAACDARARVEHEQGPPRSLRPGRREPNPPSAHSDIFRQSGSNRAAASQPRHEAFLRQRQEDTPNQHSIRTAIRSG